MAAPFVTIVALLKAHRYVVLAGMALAALAPPLWSVATNTARAGQETIILAQDGGLTPEQRRLREQQKAKQPPPQAPHQHPRRLPCRKRRRRNSRAAWIGIGSRR